MEVRELEGECVLEEMGILSKVREIMLTNKVGMACAMAMYYNVVM